MENISNNQTTREEGESKISLTNIRNNVKAKNALQIIDLDNEYFVVSLEKKRRI